MPEGQVSHRNAMVLSDAIAGSPITLVEAPEPRLGPQRLPERLTGDVLDHMEPRGKHHLFRFTSGRTLHSHLQMNGTWRAYAPGADIPRRGLWLALHTDQGTIAQYRGPVLRLYEPGARIPRVEAVGPDLLDDDVDPAGAATRLLAWRPAAMGAAAQRGAPGRWVYGRARRGCRVCGTQVRARGQGDANRTTYWCPSCQG